MKTTDTAVGWKGPSMSACTERRLFVKPQLSRGSVVLLSRWNLRMPTFPPAQSEHKRPPTSGRPAGAPRTPGLIFVGARRRANAPLPLPPGTADDGQARTRTAGVRPAPLLKSGPELSTEGQRKRL